MMTCLNLPLILFLACQSEIGQSELKTSIGPHKKMGQKRLDQVIQLVLSLLKQILCTMSKSSMINLMIFIIIILKFI